MLPGNKVPRVSVGNLVAFVARSGDLGAGGTAGPTAQQGTAGHQWLAKKKPKSWLSEVSVKHTFDTPHGPLQVAGRIDFARFSAGKNPLVEEVKTCLGDPQQDFGASEHWAQALVYGYLLAHSDERLAENVKPALLTEHDLLPAQSQLDIRLTRLDLLNRKTHSETRTHTVAELTEKTQQWVAQYTAWLHLVAQQREKSIASAQGLAFPYPEYRPQQQAVARHVFRCVRDARHLLLEAPTGSGKTLSVCFPLVKALGEQAANKVLYLTTKGSSQQVVLACLTQLQKHGLALSLLQISAKSKSCPCAASDGENYQDCPRRVGYYDRLPKARQEALSLGWLDEKAIQQLCLRHRLCPFEFSLEMAAWADWVVGDANYWYDPVIRLAVLEQGAKPAVVVDEVHNLPDRTRAMFSAQLTSFDLQQIADFVLPSLQSPLMVKRHKKCTRVLSQLAFSAGQFSFEQTLPASRLADLFTAVEELLVVIDEARTQPLPGVMDSLFGNDIGQYLQPLRRFLALQNYLAEHHICVVTAERKNAVQCQLICLNAGPYIAARRSDSQMQLGYSATLNPANYYLDNLGLSDCDSDALHWLQLPSYFPAQHRSVTLVTCVNTRWQNRAESLPQLIATINAVVDSARGNYLLFMPSFEYMDLLLNQIPAEQRRLWVVQPQASSEADRQVFVEAIINASQPTVAVAVMGGVFGEALDLPSGALRGVMVVGTGMGQPNVTNKALQQYWQQQGRDGFDYSFRAPGFTRVVQAAGRVVRSESDRGAVVLIDDRFTHSVYQPLFPPHWQPAVANSVEALQTRLHAFWQDKTVT
ncbi:ATP-dependent DNA helicase [Halioxenophilus aromaticivorans]|uniref:DNA 5'-3' helicase n=1 Tax=Halioxenophilus aromaticivorans TaxID=1306992 RepID=A0AAV3U135_9ALTE